MPSLQVLYLLNFTRRNIDIRKAYRALGPEADPEREATHSFDLHLCGTNIHWSLTAKKSNGIADALNTLRSER